MRSANFVEETTTSIAGTAGNGAITLTGIASVPRFSTVFGTQATTIRYVIEDTVGKRFETGIGSVAANVLTRTRPQVTWDGTTYDDSTPAPIAFGSTPASGNVKVRLSATAESQGVVMPGSNTVVAGGEPFWQTTPITQHIRTNTNGNSAPAAANTEYYWLYQLTKTGLLDRVGLSVGVAGVGALVKTALYSLGPNGLAGRKIVDFNIIDCSTTGGKTDSATSTWSTAGPVWLTPGWYAIGMIASVGFSVWGASPAGAVISSTPYGRATGYGDSSLVRISGKSYDTGLPAEPSYAGAALVSAHESISGAWIGLGVTP